ncbi:hypothetical protein [Bacillus benzoevorans]|uniref:Uncharacterized protein n=1 Tax=Bacillus benzoevorans TaxID=1456 RepID=A0A7X0LYE5_9BACI|nr:hypothetical protein [Bacillus benzoevorans]MBB6447417.1 hypothetical protein [Bacillus benzoevorans]
MNTVTHLNTDDYLDLYLFAKKMGDKIWQNEIVVKLRDILSGRPVEIESPDLETLWENYKTVSSEIVALYRKLPENSTNERQTIKATIVKLKKQRRAIIKQMDLANGMNYYSNY